MILSGKVALVTGAQQGIGAAIAVALAEAGAEVAITWLDNDNVAQAVAARIRQATRRAHLIGANVERLADIDLMVANTASTLGAADILMNNAGVFSRVRLLEMRESDWDHVLDINLKAGCCVTIAFAKALMAAGKNSGSAINIASQAIRGTVRGVHYSARKGGVVSMTRGMALELAPHNVRVNAIAPGLTDTAQPKRRRLRSRIRRQKSRQDQDAQGCAAQRSSAWKLQGIAARLTPASPPTLQQRLHRGGCRNTRSDHSPPDRPPLPPRPDHQHTAPAATA